MMNITNVKYPIYDEPAERYFSSGHFGHSSLGDYLRSPNGFRLRYIKQLAAAQREARNYLSLGHEVELAVLNRDLWERSVESKRAPPPTPMADYVWPSAEQWDAWGGAFRKGEAKKWKADLEAEGRIVVRNSDEALAIYDKQLKAHRDGSSTETQILAMLDSLAHNGLACELLADVVHTQVSGRCTLSFSDWDKVGIQTRPDAVLSDGSVVDIKTGKDPIKYARRYAIEWHLPLQSAIWNTVASDDRPWRFIYLQTQWPFDVTVLELGDDLVQRGHEELHRAAFGVATSDWSTDQRSTLTFKE